MAFSRVKTSDLVPAGLVDGVVFPPWRRRLGVYDLPLLVVALAGSAAVSGVDVASSWRPCSGVATCSAFLYCSFSLRVVLLVVLRVFSVFLSVFGYVFFA